MIDWIICTDRLPEKSGDYLVCMRPNDCGYRYCSVVNFSSQYWLFNWYDGHSLDMLTDDDRDYNDRVEYWAEINLPAKNNMDNLFNAMRKSVEKRKDPAKLAAWAEDFAERTAQR